MSDDERTRLHNAFNELKRSGEYSVGYSLSYRDPSKTEFS